MLIVQNFDRKLIRIREFRFDIITGNGFSIEPVIFSEPSIDLFYKMTMFMFPW